MTRTFKIIGSAAMLMLGAILAVVPAAAQKKPHDHSAAGHKHNHPTAAKAGVLEDVGEYHVEMVAADGKIVLHLRDHEAKEVAPVGFKASVLVTAGSQRLGPYELTATATTLEGATTKIPAGATAILTLTDKDGDVAQGRFRLK